MPPNLCHITTETLYDVLGVPRRATTEEIRRAYYEMARVLHPDMLDRQPWLNAEGAARRMQEVNEAWRILRDPAARASYDQSLGMRSVRTHREGPAPSSATEAVDPEYDTPFRGAAAEPGDLTVSVARALPWLVVAVVLVAIFIFTAFARKDGSGAPTPRSLIGQCVTSHGSGMVAVPCAGPNDGKVVAVETVASACPAASRARVATDNQWLCLAPVAQGVTGTTGTTG